MNRCSFFIVVFLCSSLIIKSQTQDNVVRCYTNELHAQKMLDVDFQADFEAKLASTKKYLENNWVNDKMPTCETQLILPVAVHFQNVTIDSTCAAQMALDQISILNNDFAGTNSDIGKWSEAQASGYYPNINNGESCIQFCLPTVNHPSGFGLNDGDYAITIDQTSGDSNEEWAGYLNFYVRDLGGGLIGYSPLAGDMNGDGVTSNLTAFGSYSCDGNVINSAYNLGRTMAHMVGHYLFLNHPFGNDGCGIDADNVDDTPLTDAPTFGCPEFGIINCTEPQIWMSHMDYTDDSCSYMFTEGQVSRMEAYVNSNLSGFLLGSEAECFFNQPDFVSVELSIEALLQGPYNLSNNLMNDNLRSAGHLPLNEPFTEFGYNHVNSGGEIIGPGILEITGVDAVVDWIWIEIRDGESPTEVLSTKPALITRSGQIIDVTGSDVLDFSLPRFGTFLVALRHRNHLGFRNSTPLQNYEEVVHVFNMTNDSQPLFGDNALNEINGSKVMVSGESSNDGQINAIDLNLFWRPENAEVFNYMFNTSDFNLDGITNSVDRNLGWRVNVSRIEQLD